MKNLIILFYKILRLINNFTKKIFKKEFLLMIKNLIEKDSFQKIIILDQKINFFTPNQLINWRVNTFFSKEPETLKWIDKFKIKNKTVFWDIGSNIGLYSIYAALKHGNLKVISFEPSTSNLRVLSRNISINNLENQISICQLPLSQNPFNFNKINESNFEEGFSENTFGEDINYEGKKMKVHHSYELLGTSINQLLKDGVLKCPNYMKIDVDGIEHLILSGATSALEDISLKSILVEINEDFKKQHDTIFKIMNDYHFKLKSKSRAEEFYKSNMSGVYNFIFEKNE
jgi:FkbM family methyltransferase